MMKDQDLKDIQIRLSKGDEGAFNEVYYHYVDRIHAFLIRLGLSDNSDVLQETFIAIWKNRHRIDHSKSFDAYVFTIARNFALKAFRSRLTAELSDDLALMSSLQGPEKRVINDELRKELEAAVKRLPKRPQEVFNLRKFEGLSTQEIADTLGISVSTVENHMNRALRLLRDDLTLALTTLVVAIPI